MGLQVKFNAGKNFKGLTTLIPGHVYETDKGRILLFMGFGNWIKTSNLDANACDSYFDPEHLIASPPRFMYAVMPRIQKYVSQGKMSIDLRASEDIDIVSLMHISQKPRVLVKDLGEYLPSDEFENFHNIEAFVNCLGKFNVIQTRIKMVVGMHDNEKLTGVLIEKTV